MGYNFFDFLNLIGSLGLFLFGMKFMSDGIQKLSGRRLRKIIKLMTVNRYMGIFTGFLLTAIIQSSSATTVMVVSFVNAGVLTLVESISVIMGANIGTTLTGWIISAIGLKIKISSVSLPLIGLAFPLLFFRNENYRNFAEFVIGFSILFIGLSFLKESVPNISVEEGSNFVKIISSFSDRGFASTILFVIIGTLTTITVQSSSAAMALTLVLLVNGWITFSTGAALILGENIGTTITAQIAALVANSQAKRTAWAHTLFNIFGVIWMLILFHPFLFFVDKITHIFFQIVYGTTATSVFTDDVKKLAEVGPTGLAIFHTSFNIINTLLLVGFTPAIERVTKKIIPHSRFEKQFKLKYFNSGVMSTPEIAVVEARTEIVKFAKLTQKMFLLDQMLLLRNSDKKASKIFSKLSKYETICDQLENNISEYLSEISESNLSRATSRDLKSMWSIINDLESLGDIAYGISKTVSRKFKLHIEFTNDSEEELKELFLLVDNAFKMMIENLGKENINEDEIKAMVELENQINNERNNLRDQHFIRIENGSCSTQSGLLFIDIVSGCEKLGDHIENVHEAMVGIR